MELILIRQWRGSTPGSSVEVDNETGAWLTKSGAAVSPGDFTPNEDIETTEEVITVPEKVEETKQEKSYPEPPKKIQSLQVWKDYAEDNGIDIKGLRKKNDVISAVYAVIK